MNKVVKIVCLVIYYSFLRYLPSSSFPIVGKISRYLRYHCCKHLFKKCGANVNIGRLAYFGSGFGIEIGDNSDLGERCMLPSKIIIGRNVMMAPDVLILAMNHNYDRHDIPMIEQGNSNFSLTIIEDDVWIGQRVVFTPGRHVKKRDDNSYGYSFM